MWSLGEPDGVGSWVVLSVVDMDVESFSGILTGGRLASSSEKSAMLSEESSSNESLIGWVRPLGNESGQGRFRLPCNRPGLRTSARTVVSAYNGGGGGGCTCFKVCSSA